MSLFPYICFIGLLRDSRLKKQAMTSTKTTLHDILLNKKTAKRDVLGNNNYRGCQRIQQLAETVICAGMTM